MPTIFLEMLWLVVRLARPVVAPQSSWGRVEVVQVGFLDGEGTP